MRSSELVGLGFTPIEGSPEVEIEAAYTSDLLSDVMANAPGDSVLITIQAHKNTIAVATLVDIQAIVICNGRTPPPDMVDAAHTSGVALFTTGSNQFQASCLIGQALAEK